MEFTRCFGCMEHTRSYPCARCGYDPSSDRPQPYFLRPGIILYGKYVVGRELGQGGFGITYIGWNLAQDTKVAIKEYFPMGQVIRDSGTKSQLQWFTTPNSKWARSEGMDKFLKEAGKMSKVESIPEAVRVHDIFRENGTAYIVMDFVEGRTLKEHLDANGVLSWKQAKAIFFPAIQAMEKVHQFDIVHRDISPDNIMIQPDGQVKILDLGAAKDLSINSGASSMQVAKHGFSPLELYQVGGSGTWTDVYSMAATIYYALTGVVPPAAMDRLDAAVDLIRWDLPGLQALPKHVQEALVRALAVWAKDRTQTMGDFLAQLQEDHKESTPKKNKFTAIAALCAIVLLIAVLSLPSKITGGTGKKKSEDDHVHTWQSATCDSPRTCTTCGETLGTALGHKWEEEDCTKPKTCSRCGKTEGSAVGHDWQEATYDAPKTCSRCGETEGDPLGYVEAVEGDFSAFSWDGCNTNKYVFREPVKGCTDFWLYYKPIFKDNCFVSEWRVLIQDTSGNWHSEYSFTLDETYYLHYISLNPKLNIQAVAVVPKLDGNYSWSSSMGVYELHYRD